MVTVLPLNANLPLDDAEAVYDVAGGRFEFVSVAAPIIDQLIPDIALQSLPFVYGNVDEVLTVTDQPDFSRLIEADLTHAGPCCRRHILERVSRRPVRPVEAGAQTRRSPRS